MSDPIATIEETITEVQTGLNAPVEDRDKEWRDNLALTLADLKSQLAAMTGANPELATMQVQIRELTEQVKLALAAKPTEAPALQTPPSLSVEGGNPTLETPKETLSAPLATELTPGPSPNRRTHRWV